MPMWAIVLALLSVGSGAGWTARGVLCEKASLAQQVANDKHYRERVEYAQKAEAQLLRDIEDAKQTHDVLGKALAKVTVAHGNCPPALDPRVLKVLNAAVSRYTGIGSTMPEHPQAGGADSLSVGSP